MSRPDLNPISHELNNRLAKIIAQAEAVMDLVPADQPGHEAADLLIQLVEETAAFVRDA